MLTPIILLIVSLLFISVLSNFVFILTHEQVIELWVSSFLMFILLGLVRVNYLGLDSELIFLPVAFYIPWYFLTKMSVNSINRDDNIVRETQFGGILEIAIASITFLFLFGFFRPILLGEKVDTNNAIVTSTLFFIWYFLSKYITNSIT